MILNIRYYDNRLFYLDLNGLKIKYCKKIKDSVFYTEEEGLYSDYSSKIIELYYEIDKEKALKLVEKILKTAENQYKDAVYGRNIEDCIHFLLFNHNNSYSDNYTECYDYYESSFIYPIEEPLFLRSFDFSFSIDKNINVNITRLNNRVYYDNNFSPNNKGITITTNYTRPIGSDDIKQQIADRYNRRVLRLCIPTPFIFTESSLKHEYLDEKTVKDIEKAIKSNACCIPRIELSDKGYEHFTNKLEYFFNKLCKICNFDMKNIKKVKNINHIKNYSYIEYGPPLNGFVTKGRSKRLDLDYTIQYYTNLEC